MTQLLDVAALTAAKQQAFAQALANNSQSTRNFWRTLGNGTQGSRRGGLVRALRPVTLLNKDEIGDVLLLVDYAES